MNKVVLIVEDEVLVGMMLSRKLKDFGFTICEVVGTGEEAIAAAEKHRPGAILMDISLGGGIDGMAAAGRIRQRLEVPMIFFTGYNRDRKLMARAEDLQALAVLDKLGPIEDVVAALEKAFA